MTGVLLRIGRFVAQLAAGFVILLALLVGVARLLLPEADAFADDLKRVVLERTGMQLEFERLSAGASLDGPELEISGLRLSWPDGPEILAASEVTVALNVPELLLARRVLPGYLHVENAAVNAAIDAEGELLLQGRPWRDYVRDEGGDIPEIEGLTVSLADIRLGYEDARRETGRLTGLLTDARLELEDRRLRADLRLAPDGELGRRVDLRADLPLELLRPGAEVPDDAAWKVRVRGDAVRLSPWLSLAETAAIPVRDSRGDFELTLRLRGERPVSAEVDADFTDVQVRQPDGATVVYEALSGALQWQAAEGGWNVEFDDLQLLRAGQAWPRTNARVVYRETGEANRNVVFSAGFLRLGDVLPFVRALAPEALADAGITGEPAGELSNLEGEVDVRESAIEYFSVAADIREAGYRAAEPAIDLQGFSGTIKASQDGGQLEIATRDARFSVPAVFADPLELTRLEGLAVWRAGPSGYRLLVNELGVETPHGEGKASAEFFTDPEFERPEVDLTATAAMQDVRNAVRYLPAMVPEKVRDWLAGAIRGGRSDSAEFRFRGPLREFPFREDQGEFLIRVEFADVSLDYAPGWPAVENASGTAVFENEALYSTSNVSEIAGVRVEDAEVRIDDLREGVIIARDEGAYPLAGLTWLLQNSPVGEKLGSTFQDLRAAGDGQGRVRLRLPVRDLRNWSLEGTLRTRNGAVWLEGLEPRLTALEGLLSVRNFLVTASGLRGRMLDAPVEVDVTALPGSEAASSHRAELRGALPYEKIREAFGLPDLGVVSGTAPLTATAWFPPVGRAGDPFHVVVESELRGIASRLPYPLNKKTEAGDGLRMRLDFPGRDTLWLQAALDRGLQGRFELRRSANRWRLARGAIERGTDALELPDADGIEVRGYVDSLDLDEWLGAFDPPSTPASSTAAGDQRRWQDYFTVADLRIGELFAAGYRFPDVDVKARFGEDAWDIDLRGPWTEGRLDVPYAIPGSEPVEIDLERLLLIESVSAGSDGGEEGENALSPMELPALRGQIDEFALGNLRLGAAELDVRRTPTGLATQTFTMRAPSFSLDVSGDWQVLGNAQRSRIHLELYSSDVEATLTQLGYAPLISADSGQVIADLLWEGGPGMDAIYASTGTVGILIRDGTLNNVNPGGGRLLGLLSVTSLPRRLSLDFRDVFSDRLEFAKLVGDFRLDFGSAWTCNLGLESEVADMAVVGRTGLAVEDYNQVAVVRPNVSNILPVPAAWLAGPTAGVATLLVTQIFKKPLKGIGESYYTIRGDWDAPEMQRVQRSELDTEPFADCEAQLPRLSPEEIAAIEEMAAAGAQPAASDEPVRGEPVPKE